MTQRMPAMRAQRPVTAAAIAGGLLAITLAAGCESSGSGSVAGRPPTATPPTETPSATATERPSAPPSAGSLRSYHDFVSGISLTVPVGYVVATTAAQAAARFPAVLGLGSDVAKKVTDAQARLRKTTLMIAFHPPSGGLSDNIGLLKIAGQAPTNPSDIQSQSFTSVARTSLSGVGAKNIEFSDTTLGGHPAERVNYAISTGGSTLYGRQFYVAGGKDVFIMTITAGTASRARDAADEIAGTWEFG